MRSTAFSCLVGCALLLAGCEGGAGTTTAAAGGAGAPAPPGSPPSGPPAPGDAPAATPSGEGAPAEGAPNEAASNEGAPAPSPDTLPAPGSPDGTPPPDEAGNPNGGEPTENSDETPRRPPPPRTLREAALAAFRAGNDPAAFKLLNAHFAVVPAAKEELASKMAWVPGLMRPALAPRIGIAIQFIDLPLNFKGNPMPIGSSELTSAVDQMQSAEAADTRIGGTRRKSKFARGARGPMADFSERSKGDPMANASPQTQLSYYLGESGEWFVEALVERMESGEYGPMMKELAGLGVRPPRRPAGNADGQPGGPPPGFGSATDGGAPDGAAPEGGRRGGRFGSGADSQIAGAAEDIPGGETAPAAPVRRWSTRAADKEKANLAQVKQLVPCIIWLGKSEERDEINKRAEAANVDILAVYELTLREARTGSFINNKTLLRLVNLRANKPVPGYAAEPLVNLTVEQWRQKEEKGVDPLEREITKALEALDKVLKPAPLPEAVTAERAKKRIDDLVAAKPAEPLPVIVEARYYYAKGLMSEEDFTNAAKALIGEDGFARLAARAKEGT